jgi:hypothetical protein
MDKIKPLNRHSRSGQPRPILDFRSCPIMRVFSPLDAAVGNRFVSAKTSTVIPVASALVHDALVQTSLDPQVRAIEFIARAWAGTPPVDLDAIVVTREDGRFTLDVVAGRQARQAERKGPSSIALADLGLSPIVLTAADIKREPRFSNARLVWSYRLHPVGITMRMCILQILFDEGPMMLRHLLPAVRSDRDPGPAVLAMACSDLIEVDLVTQPLGPDTIARSRA